MSSQNYSNKEFEALGVPPPHRTFLDRLNSAGPRPPSNRTTRSQPQSTGKFGRQHSPYEYNNAPSSSVPQQLPRPQSSPRTQGNPQNNTDGGYVPPDTKAVILAEHKVELLDMLHESTAVLKNIYRSKFVLGQQLKLIDPSFGGDAVGQFNLTTPPTFDPSYATTMTGNEGAAAGEGVIEGGAETGEVGGGFRTSAGDEALREKLRTAEEVIKKLYRRNNQLEVENRYLKGELSKLERFQGVTRTSSHNLSLVDGHIPMDHPTYTKKMRRRCRSIPPQRTLLRTAVNGYGLTFPPRAGQREEPPVKQDPLPVAQLKKRVLNLTEALVAVQHDHEALVREKQQRRSTRDAFLKQYLVERDAYIAQLHGLLQELVAKVNNPMKLTRAKQPSLSINPVVATNNVLKEVAGKLSEQIAYITNEIVRETSQALPVGGSSSAPPSPDKQSLQQQQDEETNAGQLQSKEAQQPAGQRRKELSRRLRGLCDTLPVHKRKQLLLLVAELKCLFTSLSNSNRSLLSSIDNQSAEHNAETIQLKMQIALLKDQLRSLGVGESEMMTKGSGRNEGGELDP